LASKIQPGELYFVREKEFRSGEFTKFVKIGLVHEKEGRSAFDRLSEHQTGNPRTLELPDGNVLFAPAIDRVEAMMHNFYASKRVSGEWFIFENESEIEEAKKHAQTLIEEVEKALPTFVEADRFAEMDSNGEMLQPSEEALALEKVIAQARAKQKSLNDLKAKIDSIIKAAHATGADLGAVAKESTRNVGGKFDAKKFEEENPEIFKKFSVEQSRHAGRFLLKFKPALFDELPQDFKALVLKMEIAIESHSSLEELNEPVLLITEQKAIAHWDDDLAIARLQVLCGTTPGIEGICTWERATTLVSSFDSKAFMAAMPELYAKYVSVTEKKSYIRPAKKKI
jgi:hypothetical protein